MTDKVNNKVINRQLELSEITKNTNNDNMVDNYLQPDQGLLTPADCETPADCQTSITFRDGPRQNLTFDLELPQVWQAFLGSDYDLKFWQQINQKLVTASQTATILPPANIILRAFNNLNPEDIKIVILGQDPYHGINQANGLSFSVPKGQTLPPSLRNIYKELATDVNFHSVRHGDLSYWAEQGVFLLNATLTVVAKQPNSHKKLGWQAFTDLVIKKLSELPTPKVFILWGNYAIAKQKIIKPGEHNLVLTAVHPSPLACHLGFFGSRPFSQANEFLLRHNVEPIDWQLRE